MEETKKEPSPEIYVGKGNASLQDDYVDFINYVFGFNGTSKNFYTLLPKCYKPEYDPAANSYVVTEDGKLKAAIGAFSHEIEVCGVRLKCRGIGNVAVHPFSRSKGYMRAALGMAMDDMVKDGIELSVLGGARARYNYFSFEREGTTLHFKIGPDAMRHHLGKERTPRFEYRFLQATDDALLDAVAELSDAQPFHPIRPRAMLYDILTSWKQVPVTVHDGDRFVGYIICGDGEIKETQVARTEDFLDVIAGAYDLMKKRDLEVSLPAFRPELAAQLYTFCESYDVMCSKMYSVLRFETVTLAFLRLKATYETLPDGELILQIHGRGGDERLLLSVKDGVPTLETTDRVPDLTLDHIEAMNLIFAPYCPRRHTLPHFARLWFPLPLYMYYSDLV